MKKFALGFILGAVIFTSIGVFASIEIKENRYPIVIDGLRKDVRSFTLNKDLYINANDLTKYLPYTELTLNSKTNQYEISTGYRFVIPKEAKFIKYKDVEKALSYKNNIYIEASDLALQYCFSLRSASLIKNTATYANDERSITVNLDDENEFLFFPPMNEYVNIKLLEQK